MYNPFDQASTYLSVGYFNEGAPLMKVAPVQHAVVESMVRKKNFSNLMKWGRLEKLSRGDCLRLSGRV